MDKIGLNSERLLICQGYLMATPIMTFMNARFFRLFMNNKHIKWLRFILEHEIMLPVIWFNSLDECVKTRAKFVGEAKYKLSAVNACVTVIKF